MTVSDAYKAGQIAFEQGKNFLEDHPYPCTDPKHYEWSAGWFERNRYYEELSRKEYQKEDAEIERIFFEEQQAKEKEKEVKKAEEKFKKSKKGKAEAAGQKSLF